MLQPESQTPVSKMGQFTNLPMEIKQQIWSHLHNSTDWMHYAMCSPELWQSFGGDKFIRRAARVERFGDLECPDNYGLTMMYRATERCTSIERTLEVFDEWRKWFPEIVGVEPRQYAPPEPVTYEEILAGQDMMLREPLIRQVIRVGRLDLVDGLVSRGCPVEWSPVEWSSEQDDPRYWRHNFPHWTYLLHPPLEYAISCGREAIAVCLLKHGATVTPENIYSAAAGRMPQLLSDAIARIDVSAHPYLLNTALVAASPQDDGKGGPKVLSLGDRNDAVIDVLLNAGANPRGELSHAARSKCIWNMVQLYHHMLKHGGVDPEDWAHALGILSKRQKKEVVLAMGAYNLTVPENLFGSRFRARRARRK